MVDLDLITWAGLLLASTCGAYYLARVPVPAVAGGSVDTKAPVTPAKSEAAPKPATTKAAVKDDAGLVNIAYVEDKDSEEELEITRVGPAASAPAEARKRVIYQPPIQKISYDDDAGVEEPTGATSLFLVHATAQTDKGLRRKTNEDSLLVLEQSNLFVVADGMGGYRGGELASRLAIESIGNAVKSKRYEGPLHEDLPREASELARAIQMANASIREAATKDPSLDGMGTTVCAARFSPNKSRIFIGHVGDSRCYRLRDGVLKAMTADHTMAEFGITGPESAHLSRAVGIWPTMPIDIVLGVPHVGDVYLLCSDGLTKMLPDETIGNVLRSEEDLKAAVDRLIFFANSNGGKDNITVIVVRVVPPNWIPKPSTTKIPTADAKA
jgi:protein phosphatase